MSSARVVVTGLGATSPVGGDVPTTWEALLAGRSGVRSLKHDGVSILMVEHVLEAVRSLCDHCVVMNAGQRISVGPAASVLADPEVVRAYLGADHA